MIQGTTIIQKVFTLLKVILLSLVICLPLRSQHEAIASISNGSVPVKTIYLPLISKEESPAPQAGVYLGAYFDPVWPPEAYGQKINDFENLVGKHHAIYHYYTNWGLGTFNNAHVFMVDQIVANNSTFMLTFMSVPASGSYPNGCNSSTGASDPSWNLDSILNGRHDEYLKTFAKEVADYDKPMFIRWGHEMNLVEYSWTGFCNGKNTSKFINAYRHIVDIFRRQGASKVQWIWSPNYASWPAEEWNTYDKYYPGDDYVDWIGVVGYNWGVSRSDSGYEWDTFDKLFTDFLTDASARYPNKSIMLADYASVEDDGGDKGTWISDAFSKMKQFPNLRAAIWHHFDPPWYNPVPHFKIDSSADALSAYQQSIQDPYFLPMIPAAP